jgi:hypothetical protein
MEARLSTHVFASLQSCHCLQQCPISSSIQIGSILIVFMYVIGDITMLFYHVSQIMRGT